VTVCARILAALIAVAGCSDGTPVEPRAGSDAASPPSGCPDRLCGTPIDAGINVVVTDLASSDLARAGRDLAGSDLARNNTTMSCGAPIACGPTTSVTYAFCSTLTNGGNDCVANAYVTSDGQSFPCSAGCTECSSAYHDVLVYCASLAPSTTCAAAQPCGSASDTYQLCTVTQGGTCQSAYYETTAGGGMFSCAGCNDCASAENQVILYCDSNGGSSAKCGSEVCSTGQLCCDCFATGFGYSCLTPSGGETCATFGCRNP
jgi:hypothetical protein